MKWEEISRGRQNVNHVKMFFFLILGLNWRSTNTWFPTLSLFCSANDRWPIVAPKDYRVYTGCPIVGCLREEKTLTHIQHTYKLQSTWLLLKMWAIWNIFSWDSFGLPVSYIMSFLTGISRLMNNSFFEHFALVYSQTESKYANCNGNCTSKGTAYSISVVFIFTLFFMEW